MARAAQTLELAVLIARRGKRPPSVFLMPHSGVGKGPPGMIGP